MVTKLFGDKLGCLLEESMPVRRCGAANTDVEHEDDIDGPGHLGWCRDADHHGGAVATVALLHVGSNLAANSRSFLL
jgi:hypothetical protein